MALGAGLRRSSDNGGDGYSACSATMPLARRGAWPRFWCSAALRWRHGVTVRLAVLRDAEQQAAPGPALPAIILA